APAMERLTATIVATGGRLYGQISALLRGLPHSSRPVYQELCPGVLRSGGKPLKNRACRDDPVRCQYCRGYKPAARPAAAVGRRLYLCAVSARRKPAADRSRYDVAD